MRSRKRCADVAELARVLQRAVLEDAFARLEREVQPAKARVAVLELIDDAQRLQVVLEAAEVAHAGVERVLARVAERRVAEVVREAIASTRSSFKRSARATVRAICATSSECVSRVR